MHSWLGNVANIRQRYFPGICVAVTIGIAASFLSEHYGAPAMLMALLLGLAFNFLRDDATCLPGIEFSAKTFLRLGVALLGLRISFSDVMLLGLPAIFMVFTAVLLTISFGVLIAKFFRVNRWFGLLSGGSVAICGASAAMAISAVLPHSEQTKRDTLFAVVAVTTLSTLAMVMYPVISQSLGLDPQQSGVFLGGTIHDVAQVVGAGYSVSSEIGDLSTFVKLLRVAMLVPVVVTISLLVRRYANDGTMEKSSIPVPLFLLGFMVLFVANSCGVIPRPIAEAFSVSASWLLLIAVAALGVKTSLEEIFNVGWRPVMLVVSETVFLALIVLAGIFCL
ncbi:MAG: putative integral membrane protein (TIGR00698 family) [Arenicella sp.]|jgi:uncharacterized integral membrane protein (TIGR00698 family)